MVFVTLAFIGLAFFATEMIYYYANGSLLLRDELIWLND
jgi:hypothetical protein